MGGKQPLLTVETTEQKLPQTSCPWPGRPSSEHHFSVSWGRAAAGRGRAGVCCPTFPFRGALCKGPTDPHVSHLRCRSLSGAGSPTSVSILPAVRVCRNAHSPPQWLCGLQDKPPALALESGAAGAVGSDHPLPRAPHACALCSPCPERPLASFPVGGSQSPSAPSPDRRLPVGSAPRPDSLIVWQGRGLPSVSHSGR